MSDETTASYKYPENPQIGDVWKRIEDYQWDGEGWVRYGLDSATKWGFAERIIPCKGSISVGFDKNEVKNDT